MTFGTVFLDRDGTINHDVHYLSRPEDFRLCPNAGEGLRRLQDMGLALIVVTNQSGIARGLFDEAALALVHARMVRDLAAFGVTLTAIYHCPHGPQDGCDCRKPLPGLILRAERDHGRRPAVMIGDAPRDILAGKAAGHATIRIGAANDPQADFTARDLFDAAQRIETWMKAS
ncbi:MAG: HAD family hydrolase [Paracoccaceae bacterium]